MKQQTFPIGRRDTPLRIESLRQARRAFFCQLCEVVPGALKELRASPTRNHEGRIVNAAESLLPTLTHGVWVDTRPLALPSDVAATLEAHATGRARPTRAGWSPTLLDIDVYRAFADHVFVSDRILKWAKKWHVDVNWVEAFATLVRARWRHTPEQSLREVLATLPAFPRLHPVSAMTPFVGPISELAGGPVISADPRKETQTQFLARAKRHYQQRSAFLDAVSVAIPRDTDLDRDCAWLVRAQVRGEAIKNIAGEADVRRQAVDRVIRDLARLIEIPLRLPRRPGRAPGRQEHAPRHRASR